MSQAESPKASGESEDPSASVPKKLAQRRRLEFIDFRLCWEGKLNRADLTDFFGISIPQASLDISRYGEIAGGNLAYDPSARVYVPTATFRPAFASSSAERFLEELLERTCGADDEDHEGGLLGHRPPVAVVPRPGRAANAEILMALQRAIREKTGVRVLYQSLTRPEPTLRVLSPHAFAHDGARWHVRAYCHERDDFRDFVVARILETRDAVPGGKSGADDRAWHTEVTLHVAPHPKLSPGQQRAIELDYGMVKGRVAFKCREALLFYFLRYLRLDEKERSPQAQQIVLKNEKEIRKRMGAL